MPQTPSDLPARDEAVGRLRRSEELLRSAQRLARVGSWEWEPGTEVVTWSEQLYEICGFDPAEPVTYSRYIAAVHPDDRDALVQAVEGAAHGGHFQLEHRIVRRDGGVRWVLCSGGFLPGSGTQPGRVLGTAQDITASREAAENARRLAESEAARREAESILDSIGELFLACDTDWRLTFVNARAAGYLERLGLSREAVLGRPIWAVLPDVVRTPLYPAALSAIRDRREVEVEARFDAVDRWFAVRIVPTERGVVSYARDVTGRKQAEAAARASHELLQAVFEGTSEAIFVKNAEGRYLLANRAAADELGRSIEEIIGRTDDEIFEPETAARFRANDAVVLASGGTHTFEESAGGSPSVFLTTKSALRGPDGRVAGLVGVSRDITARTRAEAALRDRERRQRMLAEASAALNASLDYEATLATMARLAVHELADLCVVDLLEESGEFRRVAVAHRDPAMQPLADGLRAFPPGPGSAGPVARALRTGRPEAVTRLDPHFFDRTPRGVRHRELLDRLGVASTLSVPLTARGRILGVASLVTVGAPRTYEPEDIALAEELAVRAALAVDNARLYGLAQAELAQRTAAEQRLRRWARIFEHAGWGVLIGSADGRIIEEMNPAFARIHGYDIAELAGRELHLLVAADERAALADHLATALRLGRHNFETRHVRRDGTIFPVRVDLAPVRGDDGAVEHWAVNVQDLTAQRRADEQLRQAQKMEAVGRLAGGLAHDFNNMLMIIIGFSDLLHASLAGDDARRADAEEIRRAAERASALTRQLLAFGRDQYLPVGPLDLNAVIRGVEGMLRPVLGEHITMVTGLDAALAPVRGDQGQFEQVLMNLALNARDAMPRGGRLAIETANVEFQAGYAYRTFGIDLPAGPYVMVVVSDTGSGMDAETRARIFEPFFTTRTAAGHSGLGLATVYAIVTRNGGYIWVDSEPGRGTTFTMCFPPAEADAAGADDLPRGAVRGGTETLLVVEDEDAVRRLACRVLRDQGYDVLEAAHGREALDLLAAVGREVHLVVSDVVMPVMNGRELGAHLEQLRPGLPLLYMSGYTDGEIVELGVEPGARNFLPKPFAPEALVTRVREVLDTVAVD